MKLFLISIAICAFATCASCGANTSPGDGEKVGQIVKLARVGMISKTWEGEIVRGGFQGAAGVNGQSFDFTVEGDSLADVVRQYMEAQREVRIRYRTEGIFSSFRTESGGHFLASIEPTR